MELNVGIRGLKENTNILDIKVPEHMKRRVQTTIGWYDEALGGTGLVPSQVMMLTGAPGAGKTTMLLQLADALTNAGHAVLYNTGEESLYQVRMTVERLQLKKGFICGQDEKVDSLLTKADNVIKENPKKQFFLLQDSLQTLDDGKYKDGGKTGNTPVRVCEMMTDWAKGKKVGGTFPIVIFIGQATKGGDFAGKNTIRHAVDTHGMLFFDEDKKSDTWGQRLFQVTKNRFGCNGITTILGMEATGLRQVGQFQLGNGVVEKESE